jgi:hypothetical protein
MIYLNMGHNDIDYEHKYDTTNKTLSYTLNNPIQDQLIVDGLLWLGRGGKRDAGSGKRQPQ